MKRNKKLALRFISTVIALAMTFSTLTVTTFAADDSNENSPITLEESGGQDDLTQGTQATNIPRGEASSDFVPQLSEPFTLPQGPCTDLETSDLILDRMLELCAAFQNPEDYSDDDNTGFQAAQAEYEALFNHTDSCSVCSAQLTPTGAYYVNFYGDRPRTVLRAGAPVKTDSVDFDVYMNADSSVTNNPTKLAGDISKYLDKLIADGKEQNGDKTYRINTSSATLDPTDISLWERYDHYDTKWYATQSDWSNNYPVPSGNNHLPTNWHWASVAEANVTAVKNKNANVFAKTGQLTLEYMLNNKSLVNWGNTAYLREHIYAYKDADNKPTMLFYGYGSSAFADFLYYPATATSNKTITFDVNAGETQPHSLQYAGVLINCGVKDGNLNGYALLMSYKPVNASSGTAANDYNSIGLYKIVDVPVDNLHLTGNITAKTGVTAVGTVLSGASLPSFNVQSSIALEITPTSIKVDIGPAGGTLTTIINATGLTDTNFGGFGPYVDYGVTTGHNCEVASTFTFSNLSMAFTEPTTGNSLLAPYQFAQAQYLDKSPNTFFINLLNPAAGYADEANDTDKAYLSSIIGDETVLLNNMGGLTDVDTRYPSGALGENARDWNDVPDEALSGIWDSSANPGDAQAAKLAWLIYHTIWSDETVTPPSQTTTVIAKLTLRDGDPVNIDSDPDFQQPSQVNEIFKELVPSGSPLKVYLDPSSGINIGGYSPVYNIFASDGTDITNDVTIKTDDTTGAKYFEVTNTWVAGDYKVTVNYPDAAAEGKTVISGETKLKISTDTVAPAATAAINTADNLLDIGFTNTPSVGNHTYTSDLQAYAVVYSTGNNLNDVSAPSAENRTEITAGSGSSVTLNWGGDSDAAYYAHVFLWDEAGNMVHTVTPTSYRLPKKPQTLTGPAEYWLDVKEDAAGVVITTLNTTVFAQADIAPNPLIGSISYVDPADQAKFDLVANADGTTSIVPKGNRIFGPDESVRIKVVADATATHEAAVQYINVIISHVPVPELKIVEYSTAGVTIQPTKAEYGDPVNDGTRVLEYRFAGSDNWITIPFADWNFGDNYTIPYKTSDPASEGLEPGKTYEVRVKAQDSRTGNIVTVNDTITFSTPAGNSTNGMGKGTGDVKVNISPMDGEGNLKENDVYTLLIKDGDNIIAAVTHTVTADEDAGNIISLNFPGLPDGDFSVVVNSPNGDTSTDRVVITNGTPKPLPLAIGVTTGNYEKDSILELLSPTTPHITVSGLNTLYDYFIGNPASDNSKGLTAEDNNNIVKDDSKSMIVLKAVDVTSSNENDHIQDLGKIAGISSQYIKSLYVDLTLWKNVRVAGTYAEEAKLIESGKLLTISVPLPFTGVSDVGVFRVHEGSAEKLSINYPRTPGGEYCEILPGRAILHVYKFSLYAFGFIPDNYSNTTNEDTTNKETDPDKYWDKIAGDVKNGTNATGDVNKNGNLITLDVDKRDSIPVKTLDGILAEGKDLSVTWSGGTFVIPADTKLNPADGQTVWMLAELQARFGSIINKTDHIAFIAGYPDGTVRPDNNMTRAEVAVMFTKLMPAYNSNLRYGYSFSDVSSGKWYTNAIGFMSQMGIVAGYEDGTFRPDAFITRAEFATIAAKFDNLTKSSEITFVDVPKTHWAYNSIALAAAKGWVAGYEDGTFAPDRYITRAEVVSITCHMLGRLIDAKSTEGMKIREFSDNLPSNWSYFYMVEASNAHDYSKSENHEKWANVK